MPLDLPVVTLGFVVGFVLGFVLALVLAVPVARRQVAKGEL